MKDHLVGLSDFVWQRTYDRLCGLSDEEYLWEPVPACWTIRPRDGSRFFADGLQMAPDPAPFTTIAWRLGHLTRCYGADRNGEFLGVELAAQVLEADGSLPGTAVAALELLEQAHARWRAHLVAVPADAMAGTLGPVAGPFAEDTRAGFALHMLDEFIHHGAELALLRDLHRAMAGGAAVATGDTLVDGAARSPAALDQLASDPAAQERAVRDHPDAVWLAASIGRWDLVMGLADLGFTLDAPGRTSALHLAAGAGALDAVRRLVERGADAGSVDPNLGATPLGWARSFGSVQVTDYLASRPPGG